LLLGSFFVNYAQEDRFYIRTVAASIEIPTKTEDSIVTYTGTDARLKRLFKTHWVKVFRKGFKYAQGDKLQRTYFVIAEDATFQKALLSETADLFEFGESLEKEKLKIYEPNDYGTTSTLGKNIGAQAFLDYYDFLGVPEAWYYTTGSRDVIIGISDGTVDPEDPEFKGKTTQFNSTSYAKGHGMTTAATAAAQGDNGYGIAGVCYDCSIYSTSYGDFKFFNQLLELSRAGAKVINCSWGSTKYYETAQEAINELRDNGTVIVSVPHNEAFSKTKGQKPRYPGAYEHVINVGSVQHRYDTPQDNIQISDKGKYYAASVKYHLARTGGFSNDDPENGAYNLYTSSSNNLDATVDIVAPGNFIFRYSEFVKDGSIVDNPYAATSPAAPLVTGTIGLMFSLNPSLSVDEINSIIKLTATNIDHIAANKPFFGMYGAGSLHTGRAVKFTHDMLQIDTYAVVENQYFSRWNFKLDAARRIKIKNQSFVRDAVVDFNATDEILIQEESVFLPSQNGSILLTVDPAKGYNTTNDSQE
jgi:hypothetical protein